MRVKGPLALPSWSLDNFFTASIIWIVNRLASPDCVGESGADNGLCPWIRMFKRCVDTKGTSTNEHEAMPLYEPATRRRVGVAFSRTTTLNGQLNDPSV